MVRNKKKTDKTEQAQRHHHFEDHENMKLPISWCQNNMKTEVGTIPVKQRLTDNAEFSIFKRFLKLYFFFFFFSLTFSRHSHDLSIMFLSPMQIEAIVEESSPLVQIRLRKTRI